MVEFSIRSLYPYFIVSLYAFDLPDVTDMYEYVQSMSSVVILYCTVSIEPTIEIRERISRYMLQSAGWI